MALHTSHAHITTRTPTLNAALTATRHTRSRVCSAHQLSIPLPESPHHPVFSRLCWGFQPTFPWAAFSSESSSVQTALKSSPAPWPPRSPAGNFRRAELGCAESARHHALGQLSTESPLER